MIEAALIVEKGGLKSLIDGLIVVTADEETQIERLIRDKGYKREEAVSRLGAQMPAREKMMHGDYIIDNSGSLEDTRARVKAVSEAIGF
jgi:dephospho-CoA kinase